jgi:phosphopantetheinyl transferase (holo-ACP synthase)
LAAESHAKERYVARVCTEAERERLSRAVDKKVSFWSLFAAKEAAYKVAAKLGLRRGFAHKLFEVAEDQKSVWFGELELTLSVSVAGSQLHALAWTGEQPKWGVALVADEARAGEVAREALLAALGGEQALLVERKSAPGSWDGYAPPKVMRGDQELPVDVSLSHDGKYAAWAFVKSR